VFFRDLFIISLIFLVFHYFYSRVRPELNNTCMYACFLRQMNEAGPRDLSDSFTLVSSIEQLTDDEQHSLPPAIQHQQQQHRRQCEASDSGEPVQDSEPAQLSASTDYVQGGDHAL